MYLIWRMDAKAKGAKMNTSPNIIHLQYFPLFFACAEDSHPFVVAVNVANFSHFFFLPRTPESSSIKLGTNHSLVRVITCLAPFQTKNTGTLLNLAMYLF